MTLEEKIAKIEERNHLVEGDKAWETSWTRRLLIALCTYVIIGLFIGAIGVPKPWLSALVPAIGFMLSTLTMSLFKNLWLRNRK